MELYISDHEEDDSSNKISKLRKRKATIYSDYERKSEVDSNEIRDISECAASANRVQ